MHVLAALGHRVHHQRRHRHRRRAGDALDHALALSKPVHQKADGAAIEAVNRDQPVRIEHLVEDMQQKTVAAQHDQRVRRFGRDPVMLVGQRGGGLARGGAVGDDQRQPQIFGHAAGLVAVALGLAKRMCLCILCPVDGDRRCIGPVQRAWQSLATGVRETVALRLLQKFA